MVTIRQIDWTTRMRIHSLALAMLLVAGTAFPAVASAIEAEAPADAAADEHEAALQRVLERARAHRVLLIGELHGTVETPAIVGELAARLAGEDQLLVVGLEIWRSEQPAVDRFLASAGLDEDRARLLEGPFWQIRDGRSSEAMVDLIERLRLIMLKAPLRVLAFDVDQRQDPSGGAERDRQMGEALLAALAAQPDARLLVLAGNFHTRVQGSAPWDPEHRFAGHYLASRDPYAIEVIGVSGSAWMCPGPDNCRAWALQAPAAPGLELGDELNARKHHGSWRLPQTTASPPALGAEPELMEALPLPHG